MSRQQKKQTDLNYILNIHHLVKKKLLNSHKNNSLKFLAIDPGLRNLGWCICSIEPFSILETGKLRLERKDSYDKATFVDIRLKEISVFIENLLLKTSLVFIAIEQVSFSNGKYKYAETMLLKSIGAIHLTIIKESIPLLEVSNKKAQKLLLVKNMHNSKDQIKDYIDNNIVNHNKLVGTKHNNISQDMYDAMFIAYAAYKSVIMYDKIV